MQVTRSTTTLTCDCCGTKWEFKDDDAPELWAHVPERIEYDERNHKFNTHKSFDFCSDCARRVFDAIRENDKWFLRHFDYMPSRVTENNYLSLKKEYDELKSKYDDLKEKYDDKMKATSFGL